MDIKSASALGTVASESILYSIMQMLCLNRCLKGHEVLLLNA